jgi:ABC-type multidrug transport system ATPase subunit
MDEPTAALDARAEYALFSSLRTLAADRTVLIITHRLASVRHADRIYVLGHGSVVETGTHASLMALGGLYAELYTLQASQYDLLALARLEADAEGEGFQRLLVARGGAHVSSEALDPWQVAGR